MPIVRIGNHEFGERTPLLGFGGTEAERARVNAYSRRVVALLVVAYTGYYFCRSNLPVAIPILEKDEGIDRTQISFILGAGYGTFLMGKFLSGYIINTFGGKNTLLAGLVGSIITTVLFTFKVNASYFATIRALNQLSSAVGWSAVVKIVRGWYAPSQAAHAVAIASLAESAGDAVVRLVLGGSLVYGLEWKNMFYVSAAAGAILFVPSLFVIEQPADKGMEPPSEGSTHAQHTQNRSIYQNGQSGVGPLLKSGRFWLLSAEMFGIILIRESFASFISTFIASELKVTPGYSAMASAIFPAIGAISSLSGGFILDHVRPSRRGLVPFLCLGALTASLVGMAVVSPKGSSSSFSILAEITTDDKIKIFTFIALSALSLYAPKIIVDGAFIMDLAGGEDNVETVTAAVTGLGYLGGCVSPFVSGVVADQMGWPFAMMILAGFAGATCAMSGVYWLWDLKKISDSRSAQSHP